jgi:hypothetical protein
VAAARADDRPPAQTARRRHTANSDRPDAAYRGDLHERDEVLTMIAQISWRMVGGVLLALLVAFPAAHAHEVRPAYLEVKETAPGQFSILWRTPVLAGTRLPIALKLPDSARNVKEPVVQDLTDSLVERRWIDAGPNGLAGKRIEFPGLQLTITDVLVRERFLDGRDITLLVRPTQPWFEVAASPSWSTVAGHYIMHGIQYILFGVDHLLFVLGLLLITAFTAAHSITLAIATLGYASVPVLPLNAAIALSILFLGPEIVRCWRGEASFTIRHPCTASVGGGIHVWIDSRLRFRQRGRARGCPGETCRWRC